MPEAHLEFKAKDGAWYAGTAGFEGPFLRVHFEHFPDADDERWLPTKFKTLKDVKKVIRPTSQPMQDFQCSNLRRGIFLCVACRQPATEYFEYYDAKLQEILRSPHTFELDGQECCACKFEVEWLGGPLVHRRQLVTCGDICLRVHGDIEDDPVIKEYLEEVKCAKTATDKVVSEKNVTSAPQKRKATTSGDDESEQGSSTDFMQSLSTSDHVGFGTNVHNGEVNDHEWHHGLKKEGNTEVNSFRKPSVNTQCSKSFEPPGYHLSDQNQATKEARDVVEIISDNEEDCKSSSTISRNQTDANEDFTEQLDSGIKCSEQQNKGLSQRAGLSKGDRLVTQEDVLKYDEEQWFSCTRDLSASSCPCISRCCQKSKPCKYGAMSYVPIAPFHLTKSCKHSVYTHTNAKLAANENGIKLTHSATPHTCCQNAHFYAEQLPMCDSDVHGDINAQSSNGDINAHSSKPSTEEHYHEPEESLSCSQFLLVENIDKDIVPLKALKTIRKVTCDALMLYIWPSLDYETTRKGYICYQDYGAAKVAFQKLSAEKLFLVSSKGRPWAISQACIDRLDRLQMLSVSAALALTEQAIEEANEAEDGSLLILHKGTEAYTIARGKHKLFLEQQKKLRLCFQTFSAEEKDLALLI